METVAAALNPVLRVVDHDARSMQTRMYYPLLVRGTDMGQAVTPCSPKPLPTVLSGKHAAISRVCGCLGYGSSDAGGVGPEWERQGSFIAKNGYCCVRNARARGQVQD